MTANALRVPVAISTAAKAAATTTTVTPSPSMQQQKHQQQQPPLRPVNTAISQLKTLVAPNLVRRASLNSVQLKKTSGSCSSCPAHPDRSKSIISLNTATATTTAVPNGSLRPCLRHKRVLSHSCDNLLTATTPCRSVQQQQQHFRPNSSNASICSSNNNSGKSVKFLLPEKKFVESLNKADDDDRLLRRFSIGSLVPSASNPASYAWNKALVPNCKQSWQAFGPQFLFGQNFDRYYWTSVCCPCYQCQTFPMPYSYNFGHFSTAQFSLTRASNQQQLALQNNSTKSINYQGCVEQEGSLLLHASSMLPTLHISVSKFDSFKFYFFQSMFSRYIDLVDS